MIQPVPVSPATPYLDKEPTIGITMMAGMQAVQWAQ